MQKPSPFPPNFGRRVGRIAPWAMLTLGVAAPFGLLLVPSTVRAQTEAGVDENSPDPVPRVEATVCPGEPYETTIWTSHAQVTAWTCDEYGLASFDSSQGSYVKNKTDACGETTPETGSTQLEWDDVRTVTDQDGSHDEYKFAEVDSEGNQVGETGWLTPDCCSSN